MGLLSRLLRRGRAQSPPHAALPPPVVPPQVVNASRQPVVPPQPVADGDISPERLDHALRRLREAIPAPDEGAHTDPQD
ncbi:MAG: hypothetical protein ACRDLT_15200 [Solirubrobacteraceae bacterium]